MPIPPIFGSYGTHEAHLIFSHQKGDKQNFPKTPKMAIFKINFLGKVPKSVHNPLFYTKNSITLEAQKMCLKVMDWVKTPSPPLRKNSITNPLFFWMASLTVLVWHLANFLWTSDSGLVVLVLFSTRICAPGMLEGSTRSWRWWSPLLLAARYLTQPQVKLYFSSSYY